MPSLAVLAPFHVLKSHRRLAAAVLSGREREHSHRCGTDSRAAWSLRRAATVALGRCLYPGIIHLCEQTCSLEGRWEFLESGCSGISPQGVGGWLHSPAPSPWGWDGPEVPSVVSRGPGGPELQVPLAVTQ